MSKWSPQQIEEAAGELLTAVDLLCDWMNGNDLSSDHEDQKPEDFQRLCHAMECMRAALDRGQ